MLPSLAACGLPRPSGRRDAPALSLGVPTPVGVYQGEITTAMQFSCIARASVRAGPLRVLYGGGDDRSRYGIRGSEGVQKRFKAKLARQLHKHVIDPETRLKELQEQWDEAAHEEDTKYQSFVEAKGLSRAGSEAQWDSLDVEWKASEEHKTVEEKKRSLDEERGRILDEQHKDFGRLAIVFTSTYPHLSGIGGHRTLEPKDELATSKTAMAHWLRLRQQLQQLATAFAADVRWGAAACTVLMDPSDDIGLNMWAESGRSASGTFTSLYAPEVVLVYGPLQDDLYGYGRIRGDAQAYEEAQLTLAKSLRGVLRLVMAHDDFPARTDTERFGKYTVAPSALSYINVNGPLDKEDCPTCAKLDVAKTYVWQFTDVEHSRLVTDATTRVYAQKPADAREARIVSPSDASIGLAFGLFGYPSVAGGKRRAAAGPVEDTGKGSSFARMQV
jgi:hypothetical protein